MYIYICMYVCIYVSIYMYIYIYTFVCSHLPMTHGSWLRCDAVGSVTIHTGGVVCHIHINIYIYIQIYTICIYIYTYIFVYIYIHILTCGRRMGHDTPAVWEVWRELRRLRHDSVGSVSQLSKKLNFQCSEHWDSQCVTESWVMTTNVVRHCRLSGVPIFTCLLSSKKLRAFGLEERADTRRDSQHLPVKRQLTLEERANTWRAKRGLTPEERTNTWRVKREQTLEETANTRRVKRELTLEERANTWREKRELTLQERANTTSTWRESSHLTHDPWSHGSLSLAKEPYKRDYILQKRPMILRSLLIAATP